jgi:hypothetical protein
MLSKNNRCDRKSEKKRLLKSYIVDIKIECFEIEKKKKKKKKRKNVESTSMSSKAFNLDNVFSNYQQILCSPMSKISLIK